MSIFISGPRLHASWRSLIVLALSSVCLQEAFAARILTASLVNRLPLRDSEGSLQSAPKHGNATGHVRHGDPFVTAVVGIAAAESERAAARARRRASSKHNASNTVQTVAKTSFPNAMNNSSKMFSKTPEHAYYGNIVRRWSENFDGLTKSSLASLQQQTKLNVTSIVLILVVGFSLVAFLSLCVCWFAACAALKPRERHQHVYNGRIVYEWDQTPKVANIYVTPPVDIKTTELEIDIQSQTLRIGRTGKSPFLRDHLYEEVDENASSWFLRKNGELQIRLVKVRRSDWPVICMNRKIMSTASTNS